jgi:hypothetical protein
MWIVIFAASVVMYGKTSTSTAPCANNGDATPLASIEEPELIDRILAHRRERDDEVAPMASLGAARASVAPLENAGRDRVTRYAPADSPALR